MQAVILAAGKGLRLRPVTDNIPKALVDVCGTPLIFHILRSLPATVTEIFIVVGYLGGQIRSAIGDAFDGKTVRYATQDPLDGTGSALRLLKDELRGKFLVVNGDDLYGADDLGRLVAHDLAVLVAPTNDETGSTAVVDENRRFVGIRNDVTVPPRFRVCGAYILDEQFFNYELATVTVHDKIEYSLPHTIVAIARDHAIATEVATQWQPVGTHEELARVRQGCG
jgi:bifunctional UDP-N-acetylglucosamine pyrophosphorylase/glucosamine-1-phosphate N-acetyltransferase